MLKLGELKKELEADWLTVTPTNRANKKFEDTIACIKTEVKNKERFNLFVAKLDKMVV